MASPKLYAEVSTEVSIPNSASFGFESQFSESEFITGPAASMTSAIRPIVSVSPFVTVDAMRSPSIAGGETIPPQYVLRPCGRFQMRGIHASSVAALMVNVQISAQGTDQNLPDHSMRSPSFPWRRRPSIAKLGISVREFSTRPLPTIPASVDLSPELRPCLPLPKRAVGKSNSHPLVVSEGCDRNAKP